MFSTRNLNPCVVDLISDSIYILYYVLETWCFPLFPVDTRRVVVARICAVPVECIGQHIHGSNEFSSEYVFVVKSYWKKAVILQVKSKIGFKKSNTASKQK